jgi:hypothetical protein
MGLSLAQDHDEPVSAASEPEMLWVGVIMKEAGPIEASGEYEYMPKEFDGVNEPIDPWCAMFMSIMCSYSKPSCSRFMGVLGRESENEMCSGSGLTGPNMNLPIADEGGVSSARWETEL